MFSCNSPTFKCLMLITSLRVLFLFNDHHFLLSL